MKVSVKIRNGSVLLLSFQKVCVFFFPDTVTSESLKPADIWIAISKYILFSHFLHVCTILAAMEYVMNYASFPREVEEIPPPTVGKSREKPGKAGQSPIFPGDR